jgi:hypothetical protein
MGNLAFSKSRFSFTGEALWPALAKADKFGKLKCNVVVGEDALTKLKAAYKAGADLFPEIDDWAKPGNRKKKAPPFWKPLEDKDGEVVEGKFVVTIAKNAETKAGKPQTVKVLDEKTHRPIEDKDISSGSLVTVGCSPKAWFSATAGGFGVSLNLELVIVHEAVYYSGADVALSEYGIDWEEDTSDEMASFESDADAGADDDDMDDDIPF